VPENFSNRYQTALSAGVAAGDLTGGVTSVTGIPARPFRAIISSEGANTDEIVLVTGLSGTTLTWTRAAEAIAGSQVASAHGVGATLTAIWTAKGTRSLSAGTTFHGDGTDQTAAINAQLALGGVVELTGAHPISASLVMPSNTTLILNNAALTLATGVSDVIIRNSDLTNGNTNVHILGRGRASIDGNPLNQNHAVSPVYKRLGILFVKVTNYSMGGFTIGPTNWTAIGIAASSSGAHNDITFAQGNEVLNQAGFEVVSGHDLSFKRIRGSTYDDSVYLGSFTSFAWATDSTWRGDVYNIRIEDVEVDCHDYRPLRFCCGDGYKIHNVTVDGFTSLSTSSAHLVQFLGDTYPAVPPTVSDFRDIAIRGLKGSAFNSPGGVIAIQSNLANITVDGVTVDYQWWALVGMTGAWTVQDLAVSNVNIVSVPRSGHGTLIESTTGTLTRVTIDGVAVLQANKIMDTNVTTDLTLRNVAIGTLSSTDYTFAGANTRLRRSNVTSATPPSFLSDITAPAASLPSIVSKKLRNSGNLTINGTNWTTLDSGLDMVLNARAGQWIEVGMSVRWGNEAVDGMLDVFTMVSGSPVNSVTTNAALSNTAFGNSSWRSADATTGIGGGTMPYLLVAGDISAGTVTLRAYARTGTAANKTIFAVDPRLPLILFARVLG
jgi:hypothetical protein